MTAHTFKYLFPFLLLVTGCNRDDGPSSCPSLPPAVSIKLRFVGSTDSSDLLVTNALHRDSLRAAQPCFSDSLVTRFNNYQQPGTGLGITVLDFVNLASPAPDAQPGCFGILLKWGQADTDTVRWQYRQETDADGCTYYLLDAVYFNEVQTVDTFDGHFRYWTCIK